MSLTNYTDFFAEMSTLAADSDPELVAAYQTDVTNAFSESGVSLSDPAAFEAAMAGALILLGLIGMTESVPGGRAVFGVGLVAAYVSLSDLTEEVTLP